MAKKGSALRWKGEIIGYMQVRGLDMFFLFGPWTSANHPLEVELLKLLEAEEDQVVELERPDGWSRLLLRRPPEDGEIELMVHPAVR